MQKIQWRLWFHASEKKCIRQVEKSSQNPGGLSLGGCGWDHKKKIVIFLHLVDKHLQFLPIHTRSTPIITHMLLCRQIDWTWNRNDLESEWVFIVCLSKCRTGCTKQGHNLSPFSILWLICYFLTFFLLSDWIMFDWLIAHFVR